MQIELDEGEIEDAVRQYLQKKFPAITNFHDFYISHGKDSEGDEWYSVTIDANTKKGE